MLERTVAQNLIDAMRAQGARRLIVTSLFGIGDSAEVTPFYYRLLVGTALRGAKADKAAVESEVRASDLDWTIIRPATLTDDVPTGRIHVYAGDDDAKAHKITRGDLATFLVAQLTDDRHVHAAITIANS